MAFTPTPEQQAVIKHRGNPLRVVAGPGTGKTSCIAARIEDLLLSDRVAPNRILAVTFTRAAAGETRQKLEKHGVRPDQLPDVRTLHSKAVGLLRRHASRLGINTSVRPLSAAETKLVMKDVSADLAGAGIKLRFKGSGTIWDYLKAYQSEQTGAGLPTWVAGNTKHQETLRRFADAYDRVQAFYNSIDWFRVVTLAAHLLNNHPDVLEDERSRLDYLLVDEYQDLNRADQQLVRLLLADHTGPCVVGDEDQSIYESQRYAAPAGLVNFPKDVAGAVTLPLTCCHRCPPRVLEKANKLISHNKVRIAGKSALRASDPAKKGAVATIYHKSKKAEIEWLTAKVKALHDGGYQWKDILILFTEGQIAEDYIGALQSARFRVSVMLRVAGPLDSLCFASVHATCRFIADQTDNMATRACLEYWPNLGAETIRLLRKISMDLEATLWDAIGKVANKPDKYKFIARRRTVRDFHSAMEQLLLVRDFGKLLPAILGVLADCSSDPGVKILQGFLSNLSGKEAAMSIAEALANFDQEREAGTFDADEEELPDKIRLMTRHSAKGLEAKIVFIPALEDDLMPGLVTNLEERRRLFYVSITRAQDLLIMSWASQRTGREIHRTGGRMLGKKKSGFLAEMGE